MTELQPLPDLLQPGLDLVFVGINSGKQSARLGHYYSHSNNDFWRLLSASPLVTSAVGPEDDRDLLARFGIGFTNVTDRVEADSTDVSGAELRAAAPDLKRRIADNSPRAVCFNSKAAFEAVFPHEWTPGAWGRQAVHLEGADVWVMPSSSGSARGYHDYVHAVLRDLARALGRSGSP